MMDTIHKRLLAKINFEHKGSITRVNIMIQADKDLFHLLKSPDAIQAKRVLQNLATLYNTLGYLRSKNKQEILDTDKSHYGGNPLRFLSKPINLEAIRLAFKLTEEQWTSLVNLITGIRERFSYLQSKYQTTPKMT